MRGKVIVMTGATSGLGRAAAEAIAGMGARMVLVARDEARGKATVAALEKKNPGAKHTIHCADLSSLAEVKRVAAEIAVAEPRIDILINNAGGAFAKRRLTADGLEITFATNHMSYFVLTLALLDRVKASAPARIVNTASMTYASGRIDFGNLQSEKSFSGTGAYANSKLCNVLFTRELSRRLEGTGVTANCFHPGFVATRLGHQDGGIQGIWGMSTAGALSPEQGSRTLVYLATSPEVEGVSGQYFTNCRPERLSRNAMDDTLAARLWEESERIAGLS
jgi:NAD(P)-dependent dehydrogenase (short-subunit alcohol dehydrogenase family)